MHVFVCVFLRVSVCAQYIIYTRLFFSLSLSLSLSLSAISICIGITYSHWGLSHQFLLYYHWSFRQRQSLEQQLELLAKAATLASARATGHAGRKQLRPRVQRHGHGGDHSLSLSLFFGSSTMLYIDIYMCVCIYIYMEICKFKHPPKTWSFGNLPYLSGIASLRVELDFPEPLVAQPETETRSRNPHQQISSHCQKNMPLNVCLALNMGWEYWSPLFPSPWYYPHAIVWSHICGAIP